MIPGVENRQVTFSFIHAYLAILMKHARLAMLLTALAASVSLAYYVFARQIYHSQILIQVKQLSRPTDDNVDYTDESMYYTLQQQIQSDHILERTARELGISGRHGSIRRNHVKKINARYNSESNLIVDIYTFDSNLAEQWPMALYNAFESYRKERRLMQRKNQIDSWIFDRKQVQAKLFEIDQQKEKLMRDMKQWEIKMDMVRLRKVPEELIATQETLKMFREIDAKLKDPKLSREERLSLLQRAEKEARVEIGEIVPGLSRNTTTEIYPQEGSSLIISPGLVNKTKEGWMELQEELEDLRGKLETRLKVYRPAHPEVKQLQEKLAEVEKKFEKNVNSMQNKFEAELRKLNERKQELEVDLERFKVRNEQFEDFNRRQQRIDVSRMPWEKLLAKLNADLDRFDLNEERELFVLLPPQKLISSDEPVAPDFKKTALLMVGLSVILGLGIPMLLEYLDNTFTISEDAERQLKIPSLGIVPRVEVPENGPKPPPGQAPRLVQETFRMVRTNLITKSDDADRRQMIMVTSSLPKEGKSLFSLNLAESFANLGEKTLLIDLDLRRGHLNRTLNISREPGLTDMLISSEQGSINVCRATHNPMLNFVPGGQRIENVTEVLSCQNFIDFMTRIRAQYDRIIVDTPPALGLAETTGVLPLVDGVVMVIWSGYTPVEQVKTAVNQLRRGGANFYGFVLNQLDLKCPTNYFRYYYFSDYYYTSYKS